MTTLMNVRQRLFFGLFALAFFPVCQLPALAQPRLEVVGGSVQDLGIIRASGKTIERRVVLKNTGTDTLHISEVKPECSCTTAPLEKNTLAPNDSTILNVLVDLGGNYGEFTKTIGITSNAHNQPLTTLTLKSTIYLPVMPSANFVSFGAMYVEQPTTAIAKLLNTSNIPITVISLGAGGGIRFNHKRPFTIPPNGTAELVATVTPVRSQVGSFSENIQFKTNHPDQPVCVIAAYGSVQNPLPSMLNQPDAIQQQPSTKKKKGK
jgi:hypothetical protein